MDVLKFASWESAVDAAFWHTLATKKVDAFRLDDSEKSVKGYYSCSSRSNVSTRLPALLCLNESAFDGAIPPCTIACSGTLRNTNTLEEFKAIDKPSALSAAASAIWRAILSGDAVNDPSVLNQFLVITFADLKKYKFYYWFAFPALVPQESFGFVQGSQPASLSLEWNKEQIQSLRASFVKLNDESPDCFAFLVKRIELGVKVSRIDMWDSFWIGIDKEDFIVGFADPSSLPSNPGWPLRNLLVLLKSRFSLNSIKILCYRENSFGDASSSLMIRVDMPGKMEENIPKFVGWEKNASGKLGPRLADLAPLMDPARLADTAVDLNLKLMRWRIMPDLPLEKISSTKCLLLGAGTLGCYVARALMAWGVRRITFVDNGSVSFSNPVRQPLFAFDDCFGGGKPKAQAAAMALKAIFPGVTSEGYNISIPMPGHSIINEVSTRETISTLQDLIDTHDVVFLLTDSREARWLPTLLCAVSGKITINAAMGFDTFVVLRHGMRTGTPPDPTVDPNLGCYYCSDVVAPGDSLSDRTLDQQCTVTRPGLSLLASAQCVELMVSVLCHPSGAWAPADTSANPSEPTSHPLGLVPHQIRGFLSHFSNLLVVGRAYDKCIACSNRVLSEFRERGTEFLIQALQNPKYLEELSGLTDLYKETDEAEVDWDDE